MSDTSSSKCAAASASTGTPRPAGSPTGPFVSFDSDADLEPQANVNASAPSVGAVPIDSVTTPSVVGPLNGSFFSFESDAVLQPQSTASATVGATSEPTDAASIPAPACASIGPSLRPFLPCASDASPSTDAATAVAAEDALTDSANTPAPAGASIGPSLGPSLPCAPDASQSPDVAAAAVAVDAPTDSASIPTPVVASIGPSLGPFLPCASDASQSTDAAPPAAVAAPMDPATPPAPAAPSIGPFFSFESDAVLQPQSIDAASASAITGAPTESATAPTHAGPSIGPFFSFESNAVLQPESTGAAPTTNAGTALMDLADLIAAAPSAKFKDAKKAEEKAEDSDDSMGKSDDEDDASPFSSRPAKKRTRDHKDGNKAKKRKTNTTSGGKKIVEVPATSPHYLAQTFGNKATEVDEGQKTVYVGGLDWSVTEADLEDLFNTIVEFQVVRVVRDFQGRSKGFAYADFSTHAGVQAASKKYNQTQLHGCTITVLPSKPTKRLYDEKTVFVLNLPHDADAFFAPLTVVAVRRAGGNKAYVDFENAENVLKAIEKSGTEVGGIPVTVSRSIPMKDHRWQVARGRKDVNLPARADQKKILQEQQDVSNEAAKHGKVLHVKNLAFSLTEEQVRDFFCQSGEVEQVIVVKNASGKSRGFGFVEMKHEGAAFSAMTLSGQELAGKSIVVSRSYRALTHKKQKDENKPAAAVGNGDGNEKKEKGEDDEKGDKDESGIKEEKGEDDESEKGEKGDGTKAEKGKGGKKGEKGKGKSDTKGKGKAGSKRHHSNGKDDSIPYAGPHDGPKPRARMGIGYKPPKVAKADVAEGQQNGEKEEKKKEEKRQAKDEDVPKGGLTNDDFRKFLLS